jgi:hypothetical protein
MLISIKTQKKAQEVIEMSRLHEPSKRLQRLMLENIMEFSKASAQA